MAEHTGNGFDEFWNQYPRRVAKKAAQKAWGRINPDDALVEQIMAGLKARLPEWSRMSANAARCFIPHAATWLRGERWNDEVEQAPQPRPLTEHELFLARRRLEVERYEQINYPQNRRVQ